MSSTIPKLLPQCAAGLTWILYIIIVIFIVTASPMELPHGWAGWTGHGYQRDLGACLGIFAYASGNIRFAGIPEHHVYTEPG